MLVIPRSRSPPNTFFFVICSNLLLLQQEQQQAAAHHRRQLLLAAAAARGSRRVYITRRTASSPLLSYASTRELTHTTVPDTERGHETVDIQYNVCTEYITLYMISYQTENKKKTLLFAPSYCCCLPATTATASGSSRECHHTTQVVLSPFFVCKRAGVDTYTPVSQNNLAKKTVARAAISSKYIHSDPKYKESLFINTESKRSLYLGTV